jgi:hypothetical protein
MKFTFKETKIDGRAMVKITCGEYYVITKCGQLEWLVDELNTTISKYKKGGILETNIYFALVKKVYKDKILKGSIDVLFQSKNGYEVLKKELETLAECYGKKECLNISNVPYIPKTVHAKKGSNWLKQNEYLNYMKLLKTYNY